MNLVSYGKGSSGGAANELGSLHRAGVAAVLAVHGLLDRPVSNIAGKVPVEIRLETLDATDDIACDMEDRSTWFIQAKRSAGFDKALRSTMLQWSAQKVDEKDGLVLAAATLKSGLDKLQPALDRLSSDQNAILSPREDSLRLRFIQELNDIASGQGETLIHRVRLLEFAVERETDSSFAHAAAMLEGTIVPIGDGQAAFRSLRAFFQLAAADRKRTLPADWVQAIAMSGLEVFADGMGVRGLRERATALALRDYRDAWVSRRDRLDLSMLLEGVPEIRIESLVDNYQVSWRHDPEKDHVSSLYTTIRRNDRLIVSGLPGMGKSSALVQVAANLAADDEAPVPILLDLKGIGPQVSNQSDINIPLLLSQARRLGVRTAPDALEAALQAEAAKGNAIFLVDGLDETLDKAAVTAAGLAELLSRVHTKCGFVLTTRSNALMAARQTGLPSVELTTPTALFESLKKLLEAISVVIKPNNPQRWLDDKVAWLKKSMKNHTDIWKVPLLATLTTWRAAHGSSTSPNAASLLNQVIQDSVKRWEYHRMSTPPGGNDQSLRPQMLIEGFAVIGHALNSQGSLSLSKAEEIIALEITPWGLSQPISRELARQIIWFWDNSAGVFIEVNGQLQARSRQFAELGDAYWANTTTRRSGWLASALKSSSKREAVQIAAITDPEVTQHLFNHAEKNMDLLARSRALSWIYDFSQDGSISLLDVDTKRLLKLLGTAGRVGLPFDHGHETDGPLKELFDSMHDAQDKVDGPGWMFIYHLATIPTALHLRSYRDTAIERLHLEGKRRTLVEALVAISDSNLDGHAPLASASVEAIRQTLDFPIPAQPIPVKIPGQPQAIYPPTFRPVTGTAAVAAGAAARTELFRGDMPSFLHALAKALPLGQSEAITSALKTAGYPVPEPSGYDSFFHDFLQEKDDIGGWGWLIRAATSLTQEAASESGPDRWRWRALADLVDALNYSNASIPGFRNAAKEGHEVIIQLLDAISTAWSIDRSAIAAQARLLLELAQKEDAESIIDLIEEPRLLKISANADQLSPSQCMNLVPALLSNSEWISTSAAALLFDQNYPPLADAIRNNPKDLTPNARWLSSLILCANSDDSAIDIRNLLESKSPPHRTAAALYLSQFHEAELKQYWRAALTDDDLSVRFAAGALVIEDPQPTHWSCRWCTFKNEMVDTNCRNCDLSSRPKAKQRD